MMNIRSYIVIFIIIVKNNIQLRRMIFLNIISFTQNHLNKERKQVVWPTSLPAICNGTLYSMSKKKIINRFQIGAQAFLNNFFEALQTDNDIFLALIFFFNYIS